MDRTMTAALAAVLLCTGCIQQAGNSGSAAVKEPVPVRVDTVGSIQTLSLSSYVGRVEPSKSALILNQFPGILEEMPVVRGGNVTKGTVIAKVSSETVRSAYDVAKAALQQAEDGLQRAEKVYQAGSVTDVKMVELRSKVEQARAAERSARRALEDCVVKAPFSGVISEVFCQKGEHLTAAAPLVRIVDVESVEVHFSVPENEYSRISVGDRAEVEIPALGRTVSGTVAVKGISASALSHSYDFTLKGISDSESLMPGMVCKVRLSTPGDSGIVIPATAVMTDMEGRYVWSVSPEDTVCKTYVTVGGYAGNGVVVMYGLYEGDRVITEGSRKVSTGMKVRVVGK